MVSRLIQDLPRQSNGELLLRLVGMELQAHWRRLSHALGWRRAGEVLEEDLTIPDSELCRATTEMTRAVSPELLVQHGLRSYVFGCALARRDGMSYDRELFFLASIMHDLGLTEACCGPRAFEVEGADRAYAFLLEQQVAPERARAVHHAIALHARIGLAVRHSREGALLQAGAGLDVLGLRAEDLTRSGRQRVVERFPRPGFKSEIAALIGEQARRKPSSNIAGHVGLGFLRRIHSSPFIE